MVLLAAVGLSGWLHFRHGVRAAPVAAPSIDIEAPDLRARLAQALALARRPDDPRAPAASTASATAASAPTRASSAIDADGKRCGEDQAPKYEIVTNADGLSMPEETRPAGAAYLGAKRRIDVALRTSRDPFDRSVADVLNIGDVLTPAARLDALVGAALPSPDPRLYALAFKACDSASSMAPRDGLAEVPASCARLDPRDWARRDPGNGVPWLYAFQAASAAGDAVAQQEALQALVGASRFEDRYHAAAAAVAAQRPAEADVSAQLGTVVDTVVKLTASPPVLPVIQACRAGAGGDAARATLCDTVAHTMYEHSDSLMSKALGASLHAATTGDQSLREQARKERSALGAAWLPGDAEMPFCDMARDMMRGVERMGRLGEHEAARERLRAAAPH